MNNTQQAIFSEERSQQQGEMVVFSFKNFCNPGHPTHFNGSFQENIRHLLEFGEDDSGRNRWSFQLELYRHPPLFITLYVIEEIVENSQYHRCHHCKIVGTVEIHHCDQTFLSHVVCELVVTRWQSSVSGWGHHMICKKRYHFVLPSKKSVLLQREEEVGFGHEGKGGSKLMKLQGQLMHGVVHSNGFGHLLCVNGIAGGSEVVSGRQIVDLWDRICSALHLRKVSLTDTARKATMSLRLINGIAYGQPWFANWGYQFGRGTYGVTPEMYHNSVEALQSLPLCVLVPHFGSFRQEVPMIVAKYQTISCNSLLTLGHLFHFMFELKRRLPPDTMSTMDYHGIAVQQACRWSKKRVEMAAKVIVEALKKAGNQWISRQDVRDRARIYVGDTGLLDFVLKSIGNHVIGGHVVRRMVNPVTKVLEYCLEDISSQSQLEDVLTSQPGTVMIRSRPQLMTRSQIVRDMLFIYNYVIKEQNPAIMTGIFGSVPLAVRVILDTEHLIKDYDGDQLMMLKRRSNLQYFSTTIQIFCTVNLRSDQLQISPPPPPPYDLISVPPNSTVGDLKKKAEAHFRETYLGMRSFVAESIDIGGDLEPVVGVVESGGTAVILGSVNIVEEQGKIFEGDDHGNVVVDCVCGAKEDDGKRMVCCDLCEVWQHTRCIQIPNGEEIPRVFLCRCCEMDIMALPSLLS